MFGEEELSEELKAFEAELASLRPRADGLDPRWRFLLAQEARLNENVPAGEALAAGPFLCSRCGSALSGRRGKRRWAWPAAFSAMTTVAAALLLALLARIEPQAVTPGSGENALPVAAPLAEDRADLHSPFVMRDSPQRPILFGSDETGYLTLRDQVLRFGVDSWRSPASPAAATTDFTQPVLNSRGQLDRRLRLDALFGS
jgi:hypothetical protein